MRKTEKLRGFTLVELLVVMSIIGVLVTIIGGGFRSSQMRGRDTQRKSDLKQIANALELFFSDYGKYPPEETLGRIAGCPYTKQTGGVACTWGVGEMTDTKTIYFKKIPADPVSTQKYYYRLVPNSSNQKFQLFARFENLHDRDCLAGDCANSPVGYLCGTQVCNFAITSPNTNFME